MYGLGLVIEAISEQEELQMERMKAKAKRK
jgi:hypothetical protein